MRLRQVKPCDPVKSVVQSSDHEQSLQMLQSLLQAGVVSQPEFEAKKAKLTSLAGISDSRIHNMKYDHTPVYLVEGGRVWRRPCRN